MIRSMPQSAGGRRSARFGGGQPGGVEGALFSVMDETLQVPTSWHGIDAGYAISGSPWPERREEGCAGNVEGRCLPDEPRIAPERVSGVDERQCQRTRSGDGPRGYQARG